MSHCLSSLASEQYTTQHILYKHIKQTQFPLILVYFQLASIRPSIHLCRDPSPLPQVCGNDQLCGGETKWAFQLSLQQQQQQLITAVALCPTRLSLLFINVSVCLSVSQSVCVSGAVCFLVIYCREYVVGLYLSSRSLPPDASLMSNGAFILISVMIIHPGMKGLHQPPQQ